MGPSAPGLSDFGTRGGGKSTTGINALHVIQWVSHVILRPRSVAHTDLYEAHMDQDRRGTGARILRAAADPASVLQGNRRGDRNGRHLARQPYCRYLP